MSVLEEQLSSVRQVRWFQCCILNRSWPVLWSLAVNNGRKIIGLFRQSYPWCPYKTKVFKLNLRATMQVVQSTFFSRRLKADAETVNIQRGGFSSLSFDIARGSPSLCPEAGDPSWGCCILRGPMLGQHRQWNQHDNTIIRENESNHAQNRQVHTR